MELEEKIAIMMKAISEAVHVVEHAFESSPQTVAKVFQGLKGSLDSRPASQNI